MLGHGGAGLVQVRRVTASHRKATRPPGFSSAVFFTNTKDKDMSDRASDRRLWWECTMGSKSHLNLIGKIVFFPLFVWTSAVYFACDFLFTKGRNGNQD